MGVHSIGIRLFGGKNLRGTMSLIYCFESRGVLTRTLLKTIEINGVHLEWHPESINLMGPNSEPPFTGSVIVTKSNLKVHIDIGGTDRSYFGFTGSSGDGLHTLAMTRVGKCPVLYVLHGITFGTQVYVMDKEGTLSLKYALEAAMKAIGEFGVDRPGWHDYSKILCAATGLSGDNPSVKDAEEEVLRGSKIEGKSRPSVPRVERDIVDRLDVDREG